MDYCTPHFGKQLNDLTYDDIVNFFASEKVETDELEFKSFAGNVNDNYPGIIRTICAFLNSKGGLLIWGAPRGTEVQGKNEKVFMGSLTPISPLLVKDPLISKCSDSIVPLPIGIRVKVIENTTGQCICVFEIDESNYAPHQFEKIYFMRIDGQTKPAPHHYVEALFRKIRYPELEGYLKFGRVEMDVNNFYIYFDVYLINWSPLQNVEDVSFRVAADNAVFPAAGTNDHYFLNGHEWRRESYKKVLHYGQPIRDSNVLQVERRIIETKEELFVMLAFGGKNSPSKSSEYRLDLRRLNVNYLAETVVIRRDENQLFKEAQDRKGVTKQDFLNKLLGRTPA